MWDNKDSVELGKKPCMNTVFNYYYGSIFLLIIYQYIYKYHEI